MLKIGFYVMGRKGFNTINKFIKKFGSERIAFIVCSKDNNLKNDSFQEIHQLSKIEKIKFFNRSDDFSELERNIEIFKFAISWKWLIADQERLYILHDSLLPKYRGFAPLVNSLMNEEPEIGVTAIKASNNYDEGYIVSQKKIKIIYPIKINQVIDKILPLYFDIVEELFTLISNNKIIKSEIQNHKEATFSPWLDEKDYFIDWSWSASKIKRFVDAVNIPYDGAKAYLNDEIISFFDVEVINDVKVENRNRHIGKVIFKIDKFPVLICKEGLLKLVDIRNAANNPIRIKFRSRFN